MPTSKLKGDVLNFWSVFTHNRVSVGCLQGRWVSRLAVCDQKAIIAVATRPHAEPSPHEGGGGETWWCGWTVAFQAATFPFDFNFNRYLKGNFKRRSIMVSIKRNWFFKYNCSKKQQRKRERKKKKKRRCSSSLSIYLWWCLLKIVEKRGRCRSVSDVVVNKAGMCGKCVCREPTFVVVAMT